jgi:hypothetical protein
MIYVHASTTLDVRYGLSQRGWAVYDTPIGIET